MNSTTAAAIPSTKPARALTPIDPVILTRCRETTSRTRRPAAFRSFCQRPGCPTSKEPGHTGIAATATLSTIGARRGQDANGIYERAVAELTERATPGGSDGALLRQGVPAVFTQTGGDTSSALRKTDSDG